MFATVLAVTSVWSSAALAQDKDEHPIATQVRAALKDLNRPFTMTVRVEIKEGMEAKFESAFAKAIVGTRKEKGNITYDLNREVKRPSHYLVYERWRSFAALESHLKAAHITTLLAEIGDLLAGPPEVQVLLFAE